MTQGSDTIRGTFFGVTTRSFFIVKFDMVLLNRISECNNVIFDVLITLKRILYSSIDINHRSPIIEQCP
jgi:hypothetical protein